MNKPEGREGNAFKKEKVHEKIQQSLTILEEAQQQPFEKFESRLYDVAEGILRKAEMAKHGKLPEEEIRVTHQLAIMLQEVINEKDPKNKKAKLVILERAMNIRKKKFRGSL